METTHTAFMRDLEQRFQLATQLADRSLYKIFYGQVRPATILTLGINPGGAPSMVNPDGRTNKDRTIAAASASYYENDEHDILDCDWRENRGLRKVLDPLLAGDAGRIRAEVVKTNLAFRRSAKKTDIDIDGAMSEAAPFLTEIIERVRPKLVLLTGVKLRDFTDRFAQSSRVVVRAERDASIKQVVFAAARATLRRLPHDVILVQDAHASQYGWTYDRYGVAQRIHQFLDDPRKTSIGAGGQVNGACGTALD